MKQVYLHTLLVSIAFALKAQNFSPASQFASNIGDKFRGTWTSYYANGNRCDSGYLTNNKPDGLWKSWYPNGRLRMEMHCSAKRLSSAKDEMQRIYKPGFLPAPNVREMKQLLNMGAHYEKLIYSQLYISTQLPEPEDANNKVQVNIQSGDEVDSFETSSPPFTECMVHGVYISWFDNGMLKDSGYCNSGIREGVWEEWDENMNMKAVGFYKNGLRWKDWRYYNKEGKLQYIKLYNRQEEVTETIVLK